MLWLVIHLLPRLAAVYIILSFSEYGGHRWLLHKMRLARRFHSQWMGQLCINHMSLHHKKSYNHAIHTRDDNPWQLLAAGAVFGVLIGMPIHFWIDPPTVKMLAVAGPIYAVVMYMLHRGWHDREEGHQSRLPIICWLDKRHRLRHLCANCNFNVILPLFDWLFFTEVTAQKIASRL